jgi:sugar phosphate permease
MKAQNEKKVLNTTTLLIALCWIVYTCSYLGKLGYNANITQIENAHSLSHSTAGMVSTFFFFAYGSAVCPAGRRAFRRLC